MRIRLLGLVAAGVLAAAGPIPAQICAGNPNGEYGLFLGGSAQLSGDEHLGAEVGLVTPGGLGISGGLNRFSGESDAEDVTQYVGRLALETRALGIPVGPRISLCPQAGVAYTSTSEGSVASIPLGLGLGATFSPLIGPSLQGYVIPQVVLTRIDSDVPAVDDADSTDFGARVGAFLGTGSLYVGGEWVRVFRDDSDSSFHLRVGLRF